MLFSLCLLLLTPAWPAAAQQAATAPVSAPAAAVPDAPAAQDATQPAAAQPPVPWLYGRLRRLGKALTTEQKFTFYVHQTFGPPAVLAPAFGAAIRMANPPSQYPRDWKDGPEAFGRLYGSTLATQTTKHTAEFLAEAALHYDARYFPSKATGALPRIAHALEYVVVEKTDSGATALAVPHFAGAVAGGFVGMAYLPAGYDTLSRAGQRAGSELLSIGFRNMAQEFAPELAPLARWIHLPRIIPVWWTPIQRSRP